MVPIPAIWVYLAIPTENVSDLVEKSWAFQLHLAAITIPKKLGHESLRILRLY